MSTLNVHLFPAFEAVTPHGTVAARHVEFSAGTAFSLVVGVQPADEAWLRAAATVLDKLADDVGVKRAESTAGETRDVPAPGAAT